MPSSPWTAELAKQAAANAGFTHLEWHAELASTNTRAVDLAMAGAPAGQLVVAAQQSAGRGRAGRAFSSPAGGLYVSLLLRPERGVLARYPLSLVVGLSLCEALNELGASARLKWPNDVWVGTRKAAGVLVEVSTQDARARVVVGVGINVETPATELPPEAISLCELAPQPTRAHVLEAFLRHLQLRLEQLKADRLGSLRTALDRVSALTGERVRAEVNGSPLEGLALGLAPSGALRIQPDEGPEVELISGDVRHVRPAS